MRALEALVVKRIPCPLCGAQPGVKCRTRNGNRATWQHSSRTRPAYAAWQIGYREGLRDAVDSPEDARRAVEEAGDA